VVCYVLEEWNSRSSSWRSVWPRSPCVSVSVYAVQLDRRDRSYLCVDVDDNIVASIGHGSFDRETARRWLTCPVFGCATCREIDPEPCEGSTCLRQQCFDGGRACTTSLQDRSNDKHVLRCLTLRPMVIRMCCTECRKLFRPWFACRRRNRPHCACRRWAHENVLALVYLNDPVLLLLHVEMVCETIKRRPDVSVFPKVVGHYSYQDCCT